MRQDNCCFYVSRCITYGKFHSPCYGLLRAVRREIEKHRQQNSDDRVYWNRVYPIDDPEDTIGGTDTDSLDY